MLLSQQAKVKQVESKKWQPTLLPDEPLIYKSVPMLPAELSGAERIGTRHQ